MGTRQDGDFCVPEGSSVATIEPCAADKRVLYLDGHDYVYTGMLTVTVADWSGFSDRKNLSMMIQIGDLHRGLFWHLTFETRFLNYALVPGVYEMAERAVVGSPGHPGMEITGEGRARSDPTGRFQIHEIEHRPDDTLSRVLLSFEQRCTNTATQHLAGCRYPVNQREVVVFHLDDRSAWSQDRHERKT